MELGGGQLWLLGWLIVVSSGGWRLIEVDGGQWWWLGVN